MNGPPECALIRCPKAGEGSPRRDRLSGAKPAGGGFAEDDCSVRMVYPEWIVLVTLNFSVCRILNHWK